MNTKPTYHVDPVDSQPMRWLARLSSGQRIRAMLDARELAVGLIGATCGAAILASRLAKSTSECGRRLLVPKECPPDLGLFLGIPRTLENMGDRRLRPAHCAGLQTSITLPDTRWVSIE